MLIFITVFGKIFFLGLHRDSIVSRSGVHPGSTGQPSLRILQSVVLARHRRKAVCQFGSRVAAFSSDYSSRSSTVVETEDLPQSLFNRRSRYLCRISVGIWQLASGLRKGSETVHNPSVYSSRPSYGHIFGGVASVRHVDGRPTAAASQAVGTLRRDSVRQSSSTRVPSSLTLSHT